MAINGKFLVALLTLILMVVIALCSALVCIVRYSNKIVEAQASIQWNNQLIQNHSKEIEQRPTRPEVDGKVARLEENVLRLEKAVNALTIATTDLRETMLTKGIVPHRRKERPGDDNGG